MASKSGLETGQCADVAVVILNWNGQDFLRRFLPSVLAYSEGAQVIVVDNASTDDSVGLLQREFPDVEVIRHATNLGFCEGYNTGLQQLANEYNYYVLLNSDVEVTPGWLRPQRELLEQHPNIAACQPKIRQYSEAAAQRQLFEYAGAGGGYLDRLGYPFCRGRLFDTLETDLGQYEDARAVAWATGACMLVRAAVWHQLGGLEARFFAHMEEIDLCWRMQNAGYTVWYQGRSVVYHVGGGTLHKSNPRKTYLNFRNGLALVYMNTHATELMGTMAARLVLDWVAALRFLSQGNFGDLRAIVRAHWHFLQQLAYWRQRRKTAPPRLRAAERAGTYRGSLVWAYFGKGCKKFSELEARLLS